MVLIGDDTLWSASRKIVASELVKGSWDTIAVIESEAKRLPWMSTDDPLLEDFFLKLENNTSNRAHNFDFHFAKLDSSSFSVCCRDHELAKADFVLPTEELPASKTTNDGRNRSP